MQRGIVASIGLAIGVVLAGGDGPIAVAAEGTPVKLERAFSGLRFQRPVALLQAPGEAARWFVVEQPGVVRVFDGDAMGKPPAVFVDIRDRVDDGPNEAGLLGMAFHPDFADNRQVFLSYTAPGRPLVSRVSRFTSADDGRTLDRGSERILITLDQPFGNHNGGHVAFGPDGYLYAGYGDGGAGGDPHGNGQNTQTLLGAMLRIDVDLPSPKRSLGFAQAGGGRPYAVPPDNPFAASPGGRPEIFAWGLRNPWRFSFDRATGELWVADVGQGLWEEVHRVVRGGNYGWNIREGAHCYGARSCDTSGLVDPVVEYSHAQGCSITGGYRYRGRAIPALTGVYVYGDYCSGRIWGLYLDGAGGPESRWLLDTSLSISSFGEGNDGELYVLDHRGGGIYRLAPR